MKKAKPRGEVIIWGDAKPLTPDLASRIFFGLPLAELQQFQVILQQGYVSPPPSAGEKRVLSRKLKWNCCS